MEKAQTERKDGGFEERQRTSRPHLGHNWPYVEARVEIRGPGIELALDRWRCPPRQRSDLQKRGVPMRDRGGAASQQRAGSAQGVG